MATAQNVIDIAIAEIGTKEVPANSNKIKYNKWFYGKDVQGADYPWCAVFTSWVLTQAGINFKKSASCMNLAQWFKDNECFYTSNPQPGDVVFYKFNTNSRWTNHCGIVESLKPNGLVTIEGNTSLSSDDNGGSVMRRTRNLTNVVGYGRPKYSEESISISKVLDCSKYQSGLDWAKAKADGIQFGILKVIQKDNNVEPLFEEHYKNMQDAGVPCIGVYNYIYCTTPEEAKKAAKAVLRVLKGRNVKVWMDVEDKCLLGMGEKLIDIIEAYRKVIEGGKHEFGIYSGMSFIKENILPYATQNYDYWVARYYNSYNEMRVNDPINSAKKPDIKGIQMWQYTSSGKIDGFNGRVDMSLLYN